MRRAYWASDIFKCYVTIFARAIERVHEHAAPSCAAADDAITSMAKQTERSALARKNASSVAQRALIWMPRGLHAARVSPASRQGDKDRRSQLQTRRVHQLIDAPGKVHEPIMARINSSAAGGGARQRTLCRVRFRRMRHPCEAGPHGPAHCWGIEGRRPAAWQPPAMTPTLG